MLNETEHARQRIFYGAGAILINFAPESNRVRNVAPEGRARFFKFPEQKSFLGAMWKEHMNRFEMRAGHCENVRRAIDQIGSERLAAQIADVHAIALANLHRVKTGRLSADRVHAGRSDFNVFAIPDQPKKQSFGNGTAADIAGANKKDAFHDYASRLRTRK